MAATHNRPSTPSRTLAQSPTCSSGGGGTPPRWTSRAPRTLAQSPTCSSGGGGTPPRSPSWAPRTLAQSPICSSGGGGTPPRRPSRVPRSSGSSSSAPGTASHRSSPTPASSSSTSSSSRPSPPRCSTGFLFSSLLCYMEEDFMVLRSLLSHATSLVGRNLALIRKLFRLLSLVSMPSI
ncbi:leucine-rich repeat extensin-like protein 5 isoform X2 [Triticum aestivum]|uniref:leucine-rich repeat extensin-like protein 5 isoform X2 n=1 Tax=Triticum aestivum TaxID=4565 RepID=UPI001D030785|nr:leucine-rich repeat extensin-like protein 5 isoform X2 [Triticum aestivum]